MCLNFQRLFMHKNLSTDTVIFKQMFLTMNPPIYQKLTFSNIFSLPKPNDNIYRFQIEFFFFF